MSSERTTIVCLDCRGGNVATAIASHYRVHADTYVAEHLAQTEHRIVTVPGWPMYRDAVAFAKAHVLATRVAAQDDVLCDYPLGAGTCALKARHLGRCDAEGKA